MSFLTTDEVRAAYRRTDDFRMVGKSATRYLSESVRSYVAGKTYDVFLSHCFKDAEIIAGVRAWLVEQGVSVYVDWIDDAQLDRDKVTPATAALLRERMTASRSFVFATSDASPSSKWMPWELGYFDGLRHDRIAILPIVTTPGATFVGQEYIGLYPVLHKIGELAGRIGIQKRLGSREVMSLDDFARGAAQYRVL